MSSAAIFRPLCTALQEPRITVHDKVVQLLAHSVLGPNLIRFACPVAASLSQIPRQESVLTSHHNDLSALGSTLIPAVITEAPTDRKIHAKVARQEPPASLGNALNQTSADQTKECTGTSADIADLGLVNQSATCTTFRNIRSGNRELVQKPHKLYVTFWHCAKLHVKIRPEVTEKSSRWRGSCVDRQVLDVKSVRNLSGAGVMAGQTASPAHALTR
ncbi:hypothetical protein B0H14DRAFT_2585870 [Mycena olivaceomarginata]|nr:hypothetical protein B0H14DRAFT_2585870 [Mycena olivaceomarginata]